MLAIHPGDPSIKRDELQYSVAERHPISPLDTFLDVVRNMFPGTYEWYGDAWLSRTHLENVVQATFQRVQTTYLWPPKRSGAGKGGVGKPEHSFSPLGAPSSHTSVRRRIENVEGMNVLGGCRLPPTARPTAVVFQSPHPRAQVSSSSAPASAS